LAVLEPLLSRDRDIPILMLVQPEGNSIVYRIVVCWLQLRPADALASQMDALPGKMATLILRRRKQAHPQFLTAVQTLAVVRRLQPSVIGQAK
jgi:hypothetical protein